MIDALKILELLSTGIKAYKEINNEIEKEQNIEKINTNPRDEFMHKFVRDNKKK